MKEKRGKKEALIPQIKRTISSYISEEKASINKHTLLSLGAFLAAGVIASTLVKAATVTVVHNHSDIGHTNCTHTSCSSHSSCHSSCLHSSHDSCHSSCLHTNTHTSAPHTSCHSSCLHSDHASCHSSCSSHTSCHVDSSGPNLPTVTDQDPSHSDSITVSTD